MDRDVSWLPPDYLLSGFFRSAAKRTASVEVFGEHSRWRSYPEVTVRCHRLTGRDLRTTLTRSTIAPRAPESANFREVSCPANHAWFWRQHCSALGFPHSVRNCRMGR